LSGVRLGVAVRTAALGSSVGGRSVASRPASFATPRGCPPPPTRSRVAGCQCRGGFHRGKLRGVVRGCGRAPTGPTGTAAPWPHVGGQGRRPVVVASDVGRSDAEASRAAGVLCVAVDAGALRALWARLRCVVRVRASRGYRGACRATAWPLRRGLGRSPGSLDADGVRAPWGSGGRAMRDPQLAECRGAALCYSRA
jgi:hypothetical protein